ncbi:MAG: response regulator [Desulforhopalus sp.]
MESFSHAKILVIDDEPALLELFHRILTDSGFFVDVAESAEEGIKKNHTTTYDLIITDIKMPGMSGVDFFNYVKDNVRSIPVIAMSGTPWLFENSGFDGVIAKPFCKEDLLTLIRQFIRPPRTGKRIL